MSAGARLRRRIANRLQLLANATREPPRPERETLVTVIIATYNWSSVLRHAVHSVLWQTYENFELLVIGDGCTDDSREVVEAFGDPRLRWVNLPENVGSQAGPNNRGLELARGEYVAYQGHDDVWHPKHLATLLAGAESSGADLTWTVAEVLGPPGTRMRRLSGLSATGQREPGEWIPPCTAMHRRTLTESIGGWADWRELTIGVDLELFDRAQRAGARLAAIPSLTAFKFPASERPNSYRDRHSHEQAGYIELLSRRRWALVEELAKVAAQQLSPLPQRPLSRPGEISSDVPGEVTRRTRRLRGLD
jgi:glycosyltransferase involved in cell wall biosynthesis